MKLRNVILSLALFLAFSSSAFCDDLDSLVGKWTLTRTNDQAQVYKQVLEIKKDGKLTFKMMSLDDQIVFYAEGIAKVEKYGPFQGLKVTQIKAGSTESDLKEVDEDRISIFQVDYDVLTTAVNFEKERDDKPRLDIYKKVRK